MMCRERKESKRRAGERGSALVPVVFLTVLFASLSVTALSAVPGSLRSVSERIARTKARYAAISASSFAKHFLDAKKDASFSWTGGSGRGLGSLKAPLTRAQVQAAPDGTFSVQTTSLAGGSYDLVVHAKAGGVVQTLREVLRPVSASAFRQAAFGVSGFDIDGAIMCDSYDSSTASYAEQATNVSGGVSYARANGTFASNGSIDLDSGNIFGNVQPGPCGSLAAESTVISGSRTPASQTTDMPEVTLGTAVSAYGNYFVPGTGGGSTPAGGGASAMAAGGGASAMAAGEDTGESTAPTSDNAQVSAIVNGVLDHRSGTLDIGSGVYDLTSLRVRDSGTINITGDVTIYTSSEFRTDSPATFVIQPPHGSLKIYTRGSFELRGNGIQNRTGRKPPGANAVADGDPSKLQVYAISAPALANPALRFETSKPFYGCVYAPGRALDVRVGLQFYGSMIVDSIADNMPVSLHYDEALLGGGGTGGTTYEVAARWWSF